MCQAQLCSVSTAGANRCHRKPDEKKKKLTHVLAPHVVRRSHALLHGGGCERRIPDHVATRVHSRLRGPVVVVDVEQPALVRVDPDRLVIRTGVALRHTIKFDVEAGRGNARKVRFGRTPVTVCSAEAGRQAGGCTEVRLTVQLYV